MSTDSEKEFAQTTQSDHSHALAEGPGAWEEMIRRKEALKLRLDHGRFEAVQDEKTSALEDAMELRECIFAVGRSDRGPLNWSDRASDQDEMDYLSACCWAGEALEYFGRTVEAQSLVKDQGERIRSLFNERPIDVTNRKLARQRCRTLLHYANSCLYRLHLYSDAQRLVLRCDDIVTKEICMYDFPCFRTRYRIESMHGAILRQMGDLSEARKHYQRAMSFLHKRLAYQREAVQLLSEPEKSQSIAEEESRTTYELAKCILHGLAFTRYQEGLLYQAEADVATAQVLLSRNGDMMTRAYAELMEATTARCMAGLNYASLQQAIQMASGPRAVFLKYGHDRYVSRCDYELAIGHLYLGRAARETGGEALASAAFDVATQAINRVGNYADQKKDGHWACIAKTVRSRILRAQGKFDDGRAAAQDAFKEADQSQVNNQVRLDALVARGSALMDGAGGPRPQTEAAVADFKSALALAANEKATGNCHLHLARAYLHLKDLGKAREHYDHWRRVRDKVQQAFVHDYAKKVERDLTTAEQEVLVISEARTLSYPENVLDLKRFLLGKVDSKTDLDVEAKVALLGIKRATYYQWKSELKTKKPAARKKGSGKFKEPQQKPTVRP